MPPRSRLTLCLTKAALLSVVTAWLGVGGHSVGMGGAHHVPLGVTAVLVLGLLAPALLVASGSLSLAPTVIYMTGAQIWVHCVLTLAAGATPGPVDGYSTRNGPEAFAAHSRHVTEGHHQHGEHGTAMLLGHLIAALITGVLIAYSETLRELLARLHDLRWLLRWLTRPAAPDARPAPAWPEPCLAPCFVVVRHAAPRGPPRRPSLRAPALTGVA